MRESGPERFRVSCEQHRGSSSAMLLQTGRIDGGMGRAMWPPDAEFAKGPPANGRPRLRFRAPGRIIKL